jgi:hypothetical protein
MILSIVPIFSAASISTTARPASVVARIIDTSSPLDQRSGRP